MEQTPVAKMLPPARPAGSLARPALAARVADVLGRRLTTVIAAAGYGKSTLLSSWWEMAPCAWYTADPTDRDMPTLARQLADALRLRVPELRSGLARAIRGISGPDADQPAHADALGSRLAQVVHAHVDGDLIVIIDDVDELGSANPSARLIEAFCRHAPPRLHLVLAGRSHLLFPVERLRGQGQLLELGGEQLAFTTDEVAELVRQRLGAEMPDLPERLHRLAGGWPAAVILAVEALRETPRAGWPAVLDGLDRTRTPLFAYLAEEVFAHQTAALREAVGRLAIFDQFTPDLCDAIGMVEARSVVADLAGQSLFVEKRQDGSLALRPLIRDYALHHLPLPASTARELRLTAAAWLARTGSADAAARMLLAAGAPDHLARLIGDEGASLLAAGHVATVLETCQAIPDGLRTAAVEQVEGEARQIQGDWKGALNCYERAAGGREPLPAPLARRIGLLHYLRGHVDTALAAYCRGLDDPEADPAEMASLLAWTATAHWLRGDVDACRDLAARALAAAEGCGDRRALAAAHTVISMLAALDGDRRANDAHYLLALRAAEEAGDILQTVRIRTNRASHFLEEGSYPQALQELEVAVRLAELTSFANFHALSLCNRGEARMRMGRLDEALVDLEASRDRYQQIASDMVAYPLCLIGELHRERGNLVQARAAYEEAVSIAEGSGDKQALVPALAGLATVLVGDDPGRAIEIARRAVGAGSGLDYVAALLSAGWVAAVTGERQEAARLAAAAAAQARLRRDRAGLADALALTAMSAPRPGRETQHLREAASIWRDVGNPLGEAKVALALAALETGPGTSPRRRAAEHRLEELGVHAHGAGAVAAGLLALVGGGQDASLRIEFVGPLRGHPRRRAGPALGVAVETGTRAAEAAGRPSRTPGIAGIPDGDALARRGPGEGGQPPLGGALDHPECARSRPQHVRGPPPGRQGRRRSQPRGHRRRPGAVPRRRRRGPGGRPAGRPGGGPPRPRGGRRRVRRRLPRGEPLRRLGDHRPRGGAGGVRLGLQGPRRQRHAGIRAGGRGPPSPPHPGDRPLRRAGPARAGDRAGGRGPPRRGAPALPQLPARHGRPGGRAGSVSRPAASRRGTAGWRRLGLQEALRQPEAPRLASLAVETFMVRVWRPGDGERSEGVRGTAVHLGSGRQITFSAAHGLIAFLREAAAEHDGPAPMQRSSPATDPE